MESALLPLGVLAVLICPAYHRCPWLLVLVGGAAIISYLMPETSGTIRSAAIGGTGLAVVGHAAVTVSNIVHSRSDACQEAADSREEAPQQCRQRPGAWPRGWRW
jgi:membrane-associated PAP2 superfamily phosphatase